MEKINGTTVTLLALLISSFVISNFLQKKLGKTSIWAGIVFLIIGAFVSPTMGVGLLDAEQFSAFTPLISLLIGLFGFLFGLEITHFKLKDDVSLSGIYFHGSLFLASSVLFFYTCILMFPGLSSLNGIVIGREKINIFGHALKFTGFDIHLWLALTLASMTSISSVSSIKSALIKNESSGPISSIMPNLTAPGELLSIIIFGTIFAAARAVGSASTLGWTITEWTVMVTGIGVFLGLLFWLFVGRDYSQINTYLATIAVVTLASGIAVAVGVSPLFLNFICGATLALTSKQAEKISTILNSLRGPLTVLILFFAGASLKPFNLAELALPIVYIGIRIFGLITLPKFTLRSLPATLFVPRSGRIFLFQDILIVVMGMDLIIRGHQISQLILITGIVAFVVFEIIGNIYFRKFLLDISEAKPVNPAIN